MTKHQCEWCEAPATFKIQDGDYIRYACADLWHRDQVKRLARLDGHPVYVVSTFDAP